MYNKINNYFETSSDESILQVRNVYEEQLLSDNSTAMNINYSEALISQYASGLIAEIYSDYGNNDTLQQETLASNFDDIISIFS